MTDVRQDLGLALGKAMAVAGVCVWLLCSVASDVLLLRDLMPGGELVVGGVPYFMATLADAVLGGALLTFILVLRRRQA
jgi:hypothetical protein